MLLPWDYGVRNLARRPWRTALTLVALAVVILLVFVVVGFIRGLERTLATSGESDTLLVYSINAERNIENSAIAARTADLLSASLIGIAEFHKERCVSPELFLGTRVLTEDEHSGFGLIRGVTATAPLVRSPVQLIRGSWPQQGEVIVGRLAATKLGTSAASLATGRTLEIEGRQWNIVGEFAANGSAYESEIWCRLPDLQTATKRQDISLVALRLKPGASSSEVDLFCKQRNDLELHSELETAYYSSLQTHYRPVRMLGWTVVMLVAAAGVFAGMNMMYAAVSGRIREIATLQAIGYRRRAILLSLVQEGVLLASAASLIAGLIAVTCIHGWAVRFTMGAFVLRIDGLAVLIGCAVGLLLGILGALPPAFKALRLPVAKSLKSI